MKIFCWNVNGSTLKYPARKCSPCDRLIKAIAVVSTTSNGTMKAGEFRITSMIQISLNVLLCFELQFPTSYVNHNRLETKIFDKANIAGYKAGLTIVLDTNSNDSSGLITESNGFKVLIHNIRDYPQVDAMGFSLSPGYETFSGIGK